MAYFDTCPDCGAHLDPGEHCDCREEKERQIALYSQQLEMEPRSGQMTFSLAGMGVNYE